MEPDTTLVQIAQDVAQLEDMFLVATLIWNVLFTLILLVLFDIRKYVKPQ